MSTSTLVVCNAALSHIGEQPITAITDTDPASSVCNQWFDVVVSEVLEEHAWPFATAKIALSEIISKNDIGWAYSYTYPSSCAHLLFVYNESTVDNKHEQDFEVYYDTTLAQHVIHSQLGTAYADYTYTAIPVTAWDTKFTEAVSYKLAAKIANKLIADPAMALKMSELYQRALSEAARIGASEQVKKPKQTSGYKSARG